MKINIGVSNHHIHITELDYLELFGDEKIKKHKDLKQPTHFAAEQKVNIESDYNKIEGLRILGPFRNYTQVEVSETDCRYLKIKAPIRKSGDLDDAAEIFICNGDKKIKRKALIIPQRHMHIDKKTRKDLGLNDIDVVSVYIKSEKPTILKNVMIKESEPASLELHLDSDDGNATFVKNGDVAEVIIN